MRGVNIPTSLQPSSVALSYVEHLERQLADFPPKQKGLRTRQRLEIATAKALSEKGYHGTRILDVTQEAGLAEGSFYVYFTDKHQAALSVLTDLIENFYVLHTAREAGGRTRFEAVQRTNRLWISLCRANAGLIRCLLQLGDEDPAFARLIQRTNILWYERVARRVALDQPRETTRRSILLAVYMLGSMMDELVRRLVVYPDPDLNHLLAEFQADDFALADAATILWMRVLHPREALPDDLPPVAAILADSLTRCGGQ